MEISVWDIVTVYDGCPKRGKVIDVFKDTVRVRLADNTGRAITVNKENVLVHKTMQKG